MGAPDRLIGGRYALRERLGRGGMGVVWCADDTLLGRSVAVKEVEFPSGLSDDERATLRERVLREARTAARLGHPAAVTVYDVVEEADKPFIVMELVQAPTLADVVAQDGAVAPARAAEIGLEVLGALEAAHAQGIVHRDVKPANVMVTPDGRVKLTDFGIAFSTDDSSLTSTGLVLGSPSYMAPERARGERPGPASDLYSLGATLYHAVEGTAPFDRGTPLATLAAVVNDPHPPPLASGALAPVIDGLLAKDPESRPSGAALRAALESAAAAAGTTPRAAVPPPARSATTMAPERTLVVPARVARAASEPAPRRRTPAPAVVVAGLAAVAVVISGWLLLSREPSPGRPPPSAGGNGSAPPTPGRGGTASARGEVPADWVTYTHPAGFSVRRPPGWQVRNRGGTVVDLVDPASGAYLRLDTRAEANESALGDWVAFEPAFRSRFSGYRRIRLEEVDYRGYDAADWEYVYTARGARLHAVNRGFVVAGRGYALNFQTPDARWAQLRPLFDYFAASFRPAGA